MKSLVIYYSRTGKTKLVAKIIAKEFNSELRGIKEKINRKGLLGYMRAGMDAVRGKKVQLIDPNFKINYNPVFIGTPTWASKATPAIITYLQNCDFKNKKVVLFSTFASGCGNSIHNMADVVKKKKGKVMFTFSVRTIGSEKNVIETTKSYLKKIPKNKL